MGFCFGFSVSAQVVNIPDANFKAKLIALGLDINNDGQIQTSEALAQTNINVSNSNISDLTGIQAFINLNDLNCEYNYLASLNISSLTNLQFLSCSNNQLTSLNLAGLTNLQDLNCLSNQLLILNVSSLTNLQTLYCGENQLTSLNLNGLSNLQTLYCNNNQLTSLNLGGFSNLQTLNCGNNQLTSLSLDGLVNLIFLDYGSNQLPSLNISNLTNLQLLGCANNQISSLNISSLTNLHELYCGYNQLTSLNISSLTNLQFLNCSNNQLTSLNVDGLINLNSIRCEFNQLTSLTINGLTNLLHLYCNNNQLNSLDINGSVNLYILRCNHNLLTSLNVSGLTSLIELFCNNNQLLTSLFIKNGINETYLYFNNNPNLNYICADEGQINSIQAKIILLGYTNCFVNSYCSFSPGGTFYTIQGNNRYDESNNGCDVTDFNYPNLKLNFSGGTNTGGLITNASGNYYYDVQAGTYTITPIIQNSTYFNVSPVTATVSFPLQATPFTQNFCVTANGIHNDLEVSIIPIGRARPGFDAKYKIVFKNKGTNSQSGTVNLAFNDAILDFVSSNPAVSSQVVNSLTWNYVNLAPFEKREILLTLNVNSPTETPPVNAGDVLNYVANVVGLADETPVDNVFNLHQTVVNSYDPNDKTCLEGTTILPTQVGDYVHYMIRFENTGTFPAQNIVVKDMIDTTKFDVSSLIPISSSHSMITRITQTNKVEFIFENIQLPFTTGNNQGYVAFKIKTLHTLVLGNTFSNTASIYFDYNFPILTNNYTTTVAALSNQDFDFSNYIILFPNPVKDSVSIAKKQDIEISSVTIYNMLGQLMMVVTKPSEIIDVSHLKTGTYFINIISDKGASNTKFIKE